MRIDNLKLRDISFINKIKPKEKMIMNETQEQVGGLNSFDAPHVGQGANLPPAVPTLPSAVPTLPQKSREAGVGVDSVGGPETEPPLPSTPAEAVETKSATVPPLHPQLKVLDEVIWLVGEENTVDGILDIYSRKAINSLKEARHFLYLRVK